jgi:putative membrane protein
MRVDLVMAGIGMEPNVELGVEAGIEGHDGRLYPWISPLHDQHMGALILWLLGSLMGGIAFILPLNALRLSEERAEQPNQKHIEVGHIRIDPSAWTGR